MASRVAGSGALLATAFAFSAGTTSAQEQKCVPCDPKDHPLLAPGWSPTTHNGMIYPTMCVPPTPEGEEEHAFTIGDWGGIGSHAKTFDNTATKRSFAWGLDDKAQHMVADLMKKVAVVSKPKYILNVGDNFYPGGIEAHCGNVDMCSYISTGQWENLWVNIYDGPDLGDLEWWGCLGNHDWGGFSYGRAWDQQVAFTWHHDRWLMPAMYWERKVQYCDFSVDYYMLDTNKYDAKSPGDDPDHNICSYAHSAGKNCGKVGGPTSPGHCTAWFRQIFSDQLAWLERRLNQSTADWQIIVTHFPPQYGSQVWREVAKRYGVDIMITGHRHQQEIHYSENGRGWMNLDMGGTAWTVTGGGGGVTSEGNPGWESAYTQQYGFMDMTLTKDHIHLDMWSGVTRKMRRRVTVTPVAPYDYSRRRRSRRRRAFLNATAPDATCARFGCMDTWEPDYPCQCSKSCIRQRRCCADYKQVCLTKANPRFLQAKMDDELLEQGPFPDFSEERRLRPHKHPPYFEELNLTNEERCSATRRRDSQYVRKAPVKVAQPMYGYGPELSIGAMQATPMSDALPSDESLLHEVTSDLSGEDCYEMCGGKSGYCAHFCGVGKACCAKGATDDAADCATATVFTQEGKYECVGIQDPDGNIFMKEMGIWKEEVADAPAAPVVEPANEEYPGELPPEEPEPFVDPLEPDTDDSDEPVDIYEPPQEAYRVKKGGAKWYSWALGLGAMSIATGVCLLAWGKLAEPRKRGPRRRKVRGAEMEEESDDDDDSPTRPLDPVE